MISQFVKDVHRSLHSKPLSSILTNKVEKVKKDAVNSKVNTNAGDLVDFSVCFEENCGVEKFSNQHLLENASREKGL